MTPGWVLELSWEGARNLLRHKLRSTLTLLGVVFGVAAVITMMGIGEGAQRTVLRDLEGLGLNNIIVDSVQPPEANRAQSTTGGRNPRSMQLLQYGLTQRDVEQLRAVFPDAAVTQAHLVRNKVFDRSTRIDATVLGVPPEYFTCFRTVLVSGRLLSELNERNGHRVAVVSEQAASAIHAVGGAPGGTLHIGPHDFEIIGVVRLPTQSTSGSVFIPYRTAENLYGTTFFKRETGSMELTKNEIGQAIIRMKDDNHVPEAAAVVERTLKRNHDNVDFKVTVPLELLRSKQRTQQILNLVLLVIAGISLLIGGIGIMNIMLAIVMERIPEIGIRRAVGASQPDILCQFLAETVVLSSVGGVLGCARGAAAVPLASRWIGWTGIVTPSSVVMSLAVAWLVGVVFGIAPAIQAARMDPVECLRYE